MRIRLKAAQLNTDTQSTFASPRSVTFFPDQNRLGDLQYRGGKAPPVRIDISAATSH